MCVIIDFSSAFQLGFNSIKVAWQIWCFKCQHQSLVLGMGDIMSSQVAEETGDRVWQTVWNKWFTSLNRAGCATKNLGEGNFVLYRCCPGKKSCADTHSQVQCYVPLHGTLIRQRQYGLSEKRDITQNAPTR